MALQTTIDNVKLSGIVYCVPSAVSDNSEFESVFGDGKEAKFRAMTGIKKRHISAENEIA